MTKQTQTPRSGGAQKAWTVGVLANVLFLVFQFFPLFSVNGSTLYTGHRFWVLTVGAAALFLRLMKKEKGTAVASGAAAAAAVILYTIAYSGLEKAVNILGGADVSLNFLTCLLLAASAVLMIRPSLLAGKLK